MSALGSGITCPTVKELSPWELISHQNRPLIRTILHEVTVRLDSYDPQGHTAWWMVQLAVVYHDIKHRSGKQHSDADGLSRMPFLRCAQCEIRHQGAFETKRQKKVGTVMTDSSTQTKRAEQTQKLKQKGYRRHKMTRDTAKTKIIGSSLFSIRGEGKRVDFRLEARLDARPNVRIDLDTFNES